MLMKTVCELNMCTGCGLCEEICPKKTITIKDESMFLNAVIGDDCIKCELCTKKCPQLNDVERKHYLYMRDGWANDKNIRKKSSSGGIATAVIKAFLENSGSVCSCTFKNGNFVFSMTENTDEYDIFQGSKYVKSSPYGIYKQIKKKLYSGKKVLMVGLPCQIAAAKSYIGEKNSESFYTIDLICHGTPSVNLLKRYIKEKNINFDNLKEIAFRTSTDYGMSFNGKRINPPGVRDNYLLSFLCSINFTENCYNCKYADINRVGDLTLGDSWETELPEKEKHKGVSLVLCQTEKGKELLSMADVKIRKTDEVKAISGQAQLKSPVAKGKKYEKFRSVYKGNNFNESVIKVLAYKCFKQRIKKIIMKVRGSR